MHSLLTHSLFESKCSFKGIYINIYIYIYYIYLHSVVSLKIAAPSSSMKHSVEATYNLLYAKIIHYCIIFAYIYSYMRKLNPQSFFNEFTNLKFHALCASIPERYIRKTTL